MFLTGAWRWLFASRHPDLPQFVAELRAMRVALYQLIAEAETALQALTVAEQTALRRRHLTQARERASQAPRVLSQQRPEAPVVAKDSLRITPEEAAEDLRVLLYLPKLAQFRRPEDAPLVEVDTSRVLLAFAEAQQGSRKGFELVRVYDRATKRLGTNQHWDVAPESLLEPGERDTLRSVLQQGTAAQDRR